MFSSIFLYFFFQFTLSENFCFCDDILDTSGCPINTTLVNDTSYNFTDFSDENLTIFIKTPNKLEFQIPNILLPNTISITGLDNEAPATLVFDNFDSTQQSLSLTNVTATADFQELLTDFSFLSNFNQISVITKLQLNLTNLDSLKLSDTSIVINDSETITINRDTTIELNVDQSPAIKISSDISLPFTNDIKINLNSDTDFEFGHMTTNTKLSIGNSSPSSSLNTNIIYAYSEIFSLEFDDNFYVYTKLANLETININFQTPSNSKLYLQSQNIDSIEFQTDAAIISGITVNLTKVPIYIEFTNTKDKIVISGITPNEKMTLIPTTSPLYLNCKIPSVISFEKGSLSELTVYYESENKTDLPQSTDADIHLIWVNDQGVCIYDTDKTACDSFSFSIMSLLQFQQSQITTFSEGFEIVIQSETADKIQLPVSGITNSIKVTGLNSGNSNPIEFRGSNTQSNMFSIECTDSRIEFDTPVYINKFELKGNSLIEGSQSPTVEELNCSLSNILPTTQLRINKKATIAVQSDYNKISCDFRKVEFTNSTQTISFNTNGFTEFNLNYESTTEHEIEFKSENANQLSFSFSSQSSQPFKFKFDPANTGISKFEINTADILTIHDPPSTITLNAKDLTLYDYPIAITPTANLQLIFDELTDTAYKIRDNYHQNHTIEFKGANNYSINRRIECSNPKYIFTSSINDRTTFSINSETDTKSDVEFNSAGTLELKLSDYEKIQLTLDPQSILRILNVAPYYHSVSTTNASTSIIDSVSIQYAQELIVQNPFSNDSALTMSEIVDRITIESITSNSKIDFNSISSFDPANIQLTTTNTAIDTVYIITKQTSNTFKYDSTQLKLVVFNTNQVCLDDSTPTQCPRDEGSIINSLNEFELSKPVISFDNSFKLINYINDNSAEIHMKTSLLGSSHEFTIEGSPETKLVIDLDSGSVNDFSITNSLIQFTQSNAKGSINYLEIDPTSTPISDNEITIKVNEAHLYETSLSEHVIYNVQSSLKLELNSDRQVEIAENYIEFTNQHYMINFSPSCNVIINTDNDAVVRQNSQLTNNNQLGQISINCSMPISISFIDWDHNIVGEKSILISTPNFNSNLNLFKDISLNSVELISNKPVPVSFKEGSCIKTSLQSIEQQQRLISVGTTGYITIYDTSKVINSISLTERQLIINQIPFDVTKNTGYIILQTEITSNDLVIENPQILEQTGSIISFGLLLSSTSIENARLDLENWHYFSKNDKIVIQNSTDVIKKLRLFITNNKDADNFDTSGMSNAIMFNINKCCLCNSGDCTTACGESFDGTILSPENDAASIFKSEHPKIADNFTLINRITKSQQFELITIQAKDFIEAHIFSIDNSAEISISADQTEQQKFYFYGTSLKMDGNQANAIDTFSFLDGSIWSPYPGQNNDISAKNIIIDTDSILDNFNLIATESLTVKKAEKYAKIAIDSSSFSFDEPNIHPIKLTGLCNIEFENTFNTQLTLANRIPQLSLTMKKSGQLSISTDASFTSNSISFKSIEYVTISTSNKIPFEFESGSMIKMNLKTLKALEQPNFKADGSLYIQNNRDILGIIFGNSQIELYDNSRRKILLKYTIDLVHIEIENSRTDYTPFEISFTQSPNLPVTLIATKPFSRILPINYVHPNVITLKGISGQMDVIINSNVNNIFKQFIKGEFISDIIVFNPDSDCLCSEKDTAMCQTENKCGVDFTGAIFNSIEIWNTAVRTNMNHDFTLIVCFTQDNLLPQFPLKGLTKGSNLTIISSQLSSSQINVYIEKPTAVSNDEGYSLNLENTIVNIKQCQVPTLYLNSLYLNSSSILYDIESDLELISINELRYDDLSVLTNKVGISVQNYVYIQILSNSGLYRFNGLSFVDVSQTIINITTECLIDFNVESDSLHLDHSDDISKYIINLKMNNAKSLIMDGSWSSFENDINVTSYSPSLDVKINQSNTPLVFVDEVHPRMTFDSLLNFRSSITVTDNGALTIHSLPSHSNISIAYDSVYIASDQTASNKLLELASIQIRTRELLGKLIIENENPHPNCLVVHFGYNDSYPTLFSSAKLTFAATINEAAYLLDTDDWTFQSYQQDIVTFIKDEKKENVKRIIFINNNDQLYKKFVIKDGLVPTYMPDPNLLQPTAIPNNTKKAIIIGLSVGLAVLALVTIVVILVLFLVKRSGRHQIVPETSELEEPLSA